jgi:hypothetical protein
MALAPPAITASSTQADKLAATLAQMDRIRLLGTQQLKAMYDQFGGLLNRNPYGLSAADIQAAMGDDKAALLAHLAVVKAVLNLAAPGWVNDAVTPATITLSA